MEVTRQELQRLQLAAQHITAPAGPLTVAADLCGLQAQYGANALHSLRLRSGSIDTAGLVKSWTLRGTLHLFPAADLPLYFPEGQISIFDTPYGRWRYGHGCAVPQARMACFAQIVAGALGGSPVSRDALKALCRAGGMTAAEEERVFDGWGGVIRMLAEAGSLCVNAGERRAYLPCPSFAPMDREQAERALLRRYVTNYGPVTLHDMLYFFRWTQKKLKGLLAQLPAETLTCQGRTYYYTEPPASPPGIPACVFLAGFDPLMLGYEKKESLYLPPEHLKRIFNNTGIVFPALLMDGTVRGKWKEQPRYIEVTLFEPCDEAAIRAEAAKLWPEKPVKVL